MQILTNSETLTVSAGYFPINFKASVILSFVGGAVARYYGSSFLNGALIGGSFGLFMIGADAADQHVLSDWLNENPS